MVNNAAERDVKLHSDYAATLIDNGKQRESLQQVVKQHQHSTTFIPSNYVNDKIAIVIRIMDNHEKLWHSIAE